MTVTVAEQIRSRLRIRRELPSPEECRALRIASGITQGELATAIGVTRQAVTQYESGTRRPQGRTLDAYAEAIQTLRDAA
ncbi:helix-turn-helix transcriptional regulator [Streptomyces sp. NPDC096057]|uniref:helix-turn-helix domain-containing protein n=1 Tax=Streptomyces sp. NPDC096057 TaxID=3155543 RepID=UPI00332EB515